jgi:hypothetical protein
MNKEFSILQANNTWDLVPHPLGVNVVTGKGVFHHKLNLDVSHARFKPRWVLRDFTQQAGIDFG